MVSDTALKWYVEVSSQVYGPYSAQQMQQYTQEQRIVASSHISPDPASGFYPAEAFPEFTRWTKPAPAQPPLDLTQPMREQPFSVQARRKTPVRDQIPSSDFDQTSTHTQAPSATAHTSSQPSYAVQNTRPQNPIQAQQPAYSRPAAQNASTVRPAQPTAQPSVFIIMAEINSRQAMKFLHALQKLGHAQRIGDTLWLVKTDKELGQARDYLASTLTKSDRLFILDSRNNRPAWYNIGADMDARIREFWSEKL